MFTVYLCVLIPVLLLPKCYQSMLQLITLFKQYTCLHVCVAMTDCQWSSCKQCRLIHHRNYVGMVNKVVLIWQHNWRILNNSGKFDTGDVIKYIVQLNDQLDCWFVREMINNPLWHNNALTNHCLSQRRIKPSLMTASDQIVRNYHEFAHEHTFALLDGTSAQLNQYYRIRDGDSYGLFIYSRRSTA